MKGSEMVRCHKCGQEKRLLWDIFKYDDGNYYCSDCKKDISREILHRRGDIADRRPIGCYTAILLGAGFIFSIFCLAGIGGLIALISGGVNLSISQLVDIAGIIIVLCMFMLPWYLLISFASYKLYELGYFKKQSKFFSMFGQYLEKKKIKESEMETMVKEEFIKERKVKPKKADIEEVVITKWFTILGVVISVLGLASLLVYSMKYFGAIGKICTGFAFGAVGLVLGSYLELKKKYFNLGKALIGGSWALIYFTTYAMYNIESVRIIQSLFMGVSLLLGVAVLAILHTYKYRSELVTGMNYLLIFAVLCINVDKMGASLFPLVAIFIVAVSMVFFEIRMRWVYLVTLGQAVAYLTFIIWFSNSCQGFAQDFDFITKILGILFLYFLTFSVANYLTKPKTIDEVGGKHIGYITNLIAYWSLNTVLFYKLEVISPLYFIYCFLLAFITAIFADLAYRLKERLYFITNSIYTVILLGLGLSYKIEGYLLTCVLLLLVEGLFILGAYIKERGIYKTAIIGFGIILYKMFLYDITLTPPTIIIWMNQRILLLGITFFVFIFNYLISKKIIDAIKEGKAITWGFFYASLVILGAIARLELPLSLTGVVWGLISLVLFQRGIDRDVIHFRISSYIFVVGAVWRLFLSNFTLLGGVYGISYRLLTTVPVLLIIYYFYNTARSYTKLLKKEQTIIPLSSYLAFIVLMFFLRYELKYPYVCLGWEIVSCIFLIGALFIKDINFLRQGYIAAISATVRGIFFNLSYSASTTYGVVSAVMAFVAMALILSENIFCNVYKGKIDAIVKMWKGKFLKIDLQARGVFAICTVLILSWIIGVKSKLVLLTIFFCVEGLILYILGLILIDRIWRLLGIGLLVFSIFKIFIIDAARLGTLWHILSMNVLGIFLILVSFIYAKYRHRIPKII